MTSPLRQMRRERICRLAPTDRERRNDAPRPATVILTMTVALVLSTLLIRALAALAGTV